MNKAVELLERALEALDEIALLTANAVEDMEKVVELLESEEKKEDGE